jgi:hypothetical protein
MGVDLNLTPRLLCPLEKGTETYSRSLVGSVGCRKKYAWLLLDFETRTFELHPSP